MKPGAITAALKDAKQKRGGGFIPFLTAGDPDLATTRELIIELARSGADVIEVGVPFSDPVADGPTIQRASERALARRTNLGGVLETIAAAKAEAAVPIVLFSYFNPLLRFGIDRLAETAQRSGVDGILVTDLIPEEADAWVALLARSDIDPIFLAAPTTSDARLRVIAERAAGFIYAVSRAGVTGARSEMTSDAETLVQRVKQVTDLPVAVGFGVSTPEQVRAVWNYADAAVVGSAIVAEIERRRDEEGLVREIGRFSRRLTGGANDQ